MNASNFGTQLYTYHTLVIYIKEHGYPPTKEELAEIRSVSVNTIYIHLRQLEEQGYIYRTKGWRNIRLPQKDQAA